MTLLPPEELSLLYSEISDLFSFSIQSLLPISRMATFLLAIQCLPGTFLFLLKLLSPSSSFNDPIILLLLPIYVSPPVFFLLSFPLSHLPHPFGISPFYLLPFSSCQCNFCIMVLILFDFILSRFSLYTE